MKTAISLALTPPLAPPAAPDIIAVNAFDDEAVDADEAGAVHEEVAANLDFLATGMYSVAMAPPMKASASARAAKPLKTAPWKPLTFCSHSAQDE